MSKHRSPNQKNNRRLRRGLKAKQTFFTLHGEDRKAANPSGRDGFGGDAK